MFNATNRYIKRLKADLKHWQNMLDNAVYNDQRSFANKAIKLTEKQLELANNGWTEDDINRVSYVLAQKIS